MRLNDAPSQLHAGAHDAMQGDDAQAAIEFDDRLRSAANRPQTPVEGPREQAGSPHSGAGSTPHPDSPTPQRTPSTAPNRADAPPSPRASASHTPRDTTTADPHDEHPHARAPGRDHASHRDTRRRSEQKRPPEGVALQTLLAAANPLLPTPADTPAASTAPALTPHDVAASVTQAWFHEPPAPSATGGDAGAQWSFTLGDPLTPLAALHIRGDATAGWGLQLTAGNGLPARELAAHTERLRRRLRARGQAVDRVEVDDDEQR
jgi:hypothetical protein